MRVLTLAIAILLAGCATGAQMQRLHAGMPKEDVIWMLGQPDGFKQSGDREALEYTNRLISGWSYDRADYTVILEDGEVVEYGAGEVRQSGPEMMLMMP